MIIPETFWIFQHQITVIVDNELHVNESCWGKCNNVKKQIVIDGKLPQDYQEQTFLHELFHMILDFLNENELSKNETLVNNMSELFYQAWQTMEGLAIDNKKN